MFSQVARVPKNRNPTRKTVVLRFCLLIVTSLLCSGLVRASQKETAASTRFVVIIPSYNNSQWCEKNLESVFMQTYANWTLQYVDDCSTDGTGKKVDRYIEARGMGHKCQVFHNPKRVGAMANWYTAVHRVNPRDVVVSLDGDDWLADADVLQTLADTYADPDVWVTYGSFQFEPGAKRSELCRPLSQDVIASRSIRSSRWVTSHLRTFYAALFQKIRKEDLMVQGEFFDIACDVALFFPILEMALPSHTRYIHRVLYSYNYTNPLSDTRHREHQVATDLYIRSLPQYPSLERLF